MYTILLLAGAVVSASAFLDSLHLMFNSNCSAGEFNCRNDRCIPMSKRCDNTNDCIDFSDEDDCESYLCKEPRYFKCKNKRCISKIFVCDEENDCGDFSDEKDCDSFKLTLETNSTCEKGMWQCKDNLCIPDEWVCNGENDCLDSSDETIGCSAKIPCDGFKCGNGHCVPTEWVCDGHNDCIDNTDEVDCENHLDPSKCTFDEKKFLCGNHKTCLDLHKVCDGVIQCPDGADEGDKCHSNITTCSNHGCSHECVQLPGGPKCLCPKGYHNEDEKHCTDINECEVFDICDQKCRNTPGAYECYCDHKYVLQEDKKTCKAVGGEAMMVFSSKSEIRAYTLTSELYFPLAKNLKQVVGVVYDGHHVYWTDIFSEHESIVRSIEDGSQRELLVTAGLSLPEDLAVDYLTGNIYFTDAEKQHIGVCTNNGEHCTVLVNKDIRKPRGICLNVADGEMYWTDWGKPAEISYAKMDGSNDRNFVSNDVFWPNGLALDYPNSRLYWTDARKMTLESIRLDGTDRRVVLEGIVKHPYAIAVFENRLYWSDWATHSIQSCDKFTGKNHTTIVKDNKEYIYGISIYHSALHTSMKNPCALAFCSDICLLSGTGYSCACPQGKELAADRHTCKDVLKKQMLILGAKSLLVHVQHQILGKHDISSLPAIVKEVGALAYNSLNNTLYVSDIGINKIIEVNMFSGTSKPLEIRNLGKVTCMDYDDFGNNLYICDEDKGTVEVINLHSLTSTVILHDMEGEVPESIALIPEEGVMFVALKKKNIRESHIDRLNMDGSGRTHAIESGLIGPISLNFDYDLYRAFWSDAGTGNIESTSVDGDDRHGFRSLSTSPISLTSLDTDIFWVNQFSRRVYWAQKNTTTSLNKKITLDIPDDVEKMQIISVIPKKVPTHPCQIDNGGCSHICLVSHKSISCACPIGMELKDDQKTCSKRTNCKSNEFLCHLSDECVLTSARCDGHKDCPLGEDEDDCKKPNHCSLGHFQCANGECVPERLVCDHHYDCRDKSDEHDCDHKIANKCPPEHFMCGDESCVSERFICDGIRDCMDGTDEVNCKSSTCESTQFRCATGSCIPKSWECDHEFDCIDLSDEHPDCEYTTCAENMFRCTNGKCVDNKLTCDNNDDCGDNSDELSCHVTSSSNCGIDEFPCASNTSICVSNGAKCNGTSECPQHEDEKGCSECNVDEFSCDNTKCIPVQWLCDNVDDCGDSSDEKKDFCSQKDGSKTASVVPFVHCETGFRCKSGACIDTKLACNGKHDCYDGSDEEGLCHLACEGKSNPCSHECQKTPLGPVCTCREGYKLMGDGHTCSDIDECQLDPPICSQICVNLDGKYNCDCFEGFFLRSDKKSCKANGQPMSIIYTNDNQIRELTQIANSLNVIYSDDTPKITGLDSSMANQYVYFSIAEAGTMHRINTITRKREYIEHVGRPQKLAFDWSTNNVYYANEESGSKSISVCNFDEKVCGNLIPIDIHRQVSAIAVDSANKVIFYSVTSWWVFNSPSYVIYRASLDGTEKREVVKNSPGYVTDLTLDVHKNKLYYVDQHNSQIKTVSYEGKSNIVLFPNLTRPIGLKFFENHLYYSGVGGYMTKCKLYESKTCDTFKIHGTSSELFVIAQKSLQPVVKNVCDGHRCSYMCVPGGSGVGSDYKCLCEDGSLLENDSKKCEGILRESEDDRRPIEVHTVQMLENGKSRNHSGSLVVAVLVPMCLVVLGLILYIFAKRRNSGRLNISMRFYNPNYGRQSDDAKPILTPGQHEYTNPHFAEVGANDADETKAFNVE